MSDRPALFDHRLRNPAQDLMRGLMLLLIVISNAQFFLWAATHGASGWHPIDGRAADQFMRLLMIVFLDLRVYPLFAFLFGYGMMQVYRRRVESGYTKRAAVRVLWRRGLVLILFGAAHAALLLGGDILGAYGLMSLVVAWLFLRRSDRTLIVTIGIALTLLVLIVLAGWTQVRAGVEAEPGPPTFAAYASDAEHWLASVPTRLGTWLAVTLGSGLFGFASYAAMLLGVLAARHRVIESPDRHLRLLRVTAIVGIPIGLAGGAYAALVHHGVIELPVVAVIAWGPLFNLQVLTGLPAAMGYVALLLLIVHRLSARALATVPLRAVAASGKRALSSYLAHSVLMVPLLSAWGLGLGVRMNSATVTLFACAVWAVVLVACFHAERMRMHGPAEMLLRRLAYDKASDSK